MEYRKLGRTGLMVYRVVSIAEKRGKEPAQVALNWVKDRTGIASPIIGAWSPEQLENNLGATGWALSPDALDSLEEISALPYAYPYNMIARANA